MVSSKNQRNYKLKQSWYSKNNRNQRSGGGGKTAKKNSAVKPVKKPPVKISFLGGLNEIGKTSPLSSAKATL